MLLPVKAIILRAMLSHQVETLPVVYITPSYVLSSLCGNYPKLRMTQRKWISFTQPVYIMPELDKYMLISQCICTYHTNIHLFCNTWYEASFMITGLKTKLLPVKKTFLRAESSS